MTDRRCIKPRDGLSVRDPDAPGASPLPPHGKAVAWSNYWQRRLSDGDIEPTSEREVEAAGAKVAAPKTPATGKGADQ